MLTIRHLNGALAGTDSKIADKARVTVGRQLDCDVQFPPEETAVARHHFALVKKPSGSWTVELFGTPFVAIDGTPADNGQVVRDGAKIELGRIGGPALGVEIAEDARSDNYLKTAGQAEAPSPRAIATQAGTMARAARLAAAVAGVVAVGGGVFALYNYIATSRATARLESAQQEFSYALAREAETNIGADVRSRLARAVYNVQLVDAQGGIDVGGGTASVVGPHELATNGHVAISFQTLRPGERMIVRAPGENGATYQVTGVTIHPGYMALEAFIRSDIRVRSNFRDLRRDRLGGNGYDVALLHVQETLPQWQRLDIASPLELAELAPGVPLVSAGYPVELLANNWALGKSANPELHVGLVTSVTDMFGLPAPLEHRQLVHFDVPATGGQSGSPVLDRHGRIVALLNSGNAYKVDGGRLPNAAMINFGQRADLVRDLLDGTAQRKIADARVYWEEVAKNFYQGRPVVVRELINSARQELDLEQSAQPRLLAEIKATLNASKGSKKLWKGVNETTKRPYDYDEYLSAFLSKQKLAPGYDYLFVVIAEGGPTRLSIEMDGKVVATNLDSNYPRISCRLLTVAQQNNGDPKGRAACASGHERADAMRIAEGDTRDRDVGLVIWNNKDADDPLLTADLNYVLRIYQWPKRDQSAVLR